MAPKKPSKHNKLPMVPKSKSQHSPTLSSKDPSLSSSRPTTSNDKKLERLELERESKIPCRKRCFDYIYNREKKSFCGRTCKSWFYIIAYSIMYLTFLSAYTLVFLYGSLCILKATTDFKNPDNLQLLTYSEYGIGLTATPTAESNQPIIWYRMDHGEDYQKYINALNNLLVKRRRKWDVNLLGPCSQPPYGYGANPCIVVRINKRFHWSGKPLDVNSTVAQTAPLQVQQWLKRDKKLWLHCDGSNSYDKEHIGRIRYFPDPPGFDPSVFPLKEDSPLVAIQISDFTMSVSLAIECKLWYAHGPSSVKFILYVSDDRTISNRSNI